MPKRSRNGEAKEPALVVAPTKVKGGKSNLMERETGPSIIIISN